MGSFHCPEILPRDTYFIPPETWLLVIVLLRFPFTSFLGFFNSRHSLRDSDAKALGGNCSSQLLFAPGSEAVTPLSNACIVCPAVWFGCCCFSYLVHPVVISMEEGASSPACPPPPAHSIRLAVLIMVRFVPQKIFLSGYFLSFSVIPSCTLGFLK